MTCPLSTGFLSSTVETSCETVSDMAKFSHGSISSPVPFFLFSATIVIERIYWSARVSLWAEQLANLGSRQVLLRAPLVVSLVVLSFITVSPLLGHGVLYPN